MMWTSIAGAAAMGLLLVGPANAAQDAPDLSEKTDSVGSYETFLLAINASGLPGSPESDERRTLAAATDEALPPHPHGNLGKLFDPEKKTTLAAVLSYHLLPGETFASTWSDEKLALETKGWQALTIKGSDTLLAVGDAERATKNWVTADQFAPGIKSGSPTPSS